MVDQLTTCQPADTAGRTRTRFFPGLLLGSDDLTQEQIYFLEKHRRHNRLLHGWGVVCGARVRAGSDPCQIVVEPGYILGPFGDEILIDRETIVDLCREGLDGNAVSPCGGALDPWCSDVQVDRQAGQTLYVAIRYDECQTRPVRSAAGACGCDLTDCEYSRIRESFAIKVLTRLPSTYDPMPPANLLSAVECVNDDERRGRTCPACPSEPWVILADVTLTADRQIDEIDCFTHRRYVASFAEYYFLCETGQDEGFNRDNIRIRAREAARTLGRPVLLDLSAAVDDTPVARIPVRTREGAWLTMPVYFDVNPGETYATLLGREGDRQFYDPETDEVYTLREMFALTDVDPNATVSSITEATLPLEGVRLNVGNLRVVRASLEDVLDSDGIERWNSGRAGRIDQASALPATDLAGVSPRSVLGQKLSGRTIADIFGQDQQAFVDAMLEDVSGRQRANVERQARSIWVNAKRIERLQTEWNM